MRTAVFRIGITSATTGFLSDKRDFVRGARLARFWHLQKKNKDEYPRWRVGVNEEGGEGVRLRMESHMQ